MIYLQILIGAALSVLVHELGHVAAHIAFRVPVRLFEFGKGPVLFRFGRVEWRLIPLAGAVYPAGAEIAKSPLGRITIALSGIMAQWVGMYVIALAGLQEHTSLQIIAVTYGICTLYGTAMMLLPYRGTDSYYFVQTVKQLLRREMGHGKGK